jgi:hypothetical protein
MLRQRSLSHEVFQLSRRVGARAQCLREIETGREAAIDATANKA